VDDHPLSALFLVEVGRPHDPTASAFAITGLHLVDMQARETVGAMITSSSWCWQYSFSTIDAVKTVIGAIFWEH
jgi:hypothetical protein